MNTAITLLPLWAVRPGQSLIACTTVHLNPHPFQCHGQESVDLYVYCPMGQTTFTEPQCLYKGTPYPSPLLVPWSRKSRSITLLPLWAVRPVQRLSACTTVHLTPHSLLVPWSRKSIALPLLPLYAVRPVQSLSACTRLHLTPHRFYCCGQEKVQLYLYSPYVPYGLYRASVPVQRYTLPLTTSSAVVKKD